MPKPPAIFYSEHSDDSLLSMSTDIVSHIDSNRDVIVVLMTAGCSDYMLNVLNGNVDNYEGYRHNPVLENYIDGVLTKEDIHHARINEFVSEIGQYRLYANGRVNVSFEIQGEDEGISLERHKDIIRSYAQRYPGASMKSMSHLDSHKDHANCGEALRQLKNEGVVADARYFVKLEDRTRNDIKSLKPWTLRPNPAQKAAVLRAARPYLAFNPYVGSYAFGKHSVSPTFDQFMLDPYVVIHA